MDPRVYVVRSIAHLLNDYAPQKIAQTLFRRLYGYTSIIEVRHSTHFWVN
jgi:hypothetical protein